MATRSYQLFLGWLLAPILLVCSVMHTLMPAAEELGTKGDSGISGAVGVPLFYRAGDAEQSSEMSPAPA